MSIENQIIEHTSQPDSAAEKLHDQEQQRYEEIFYSLINGNHEHVVRFYNSAHCDKPEAEKAVVYAMMGRYDSLVLHIQEVIDELYVNGMDCMIGPARNMSNVVERIVTFAISTYPAHDKDTQEKIEVFFHGLTDLLLEYEIRTGDIADIEDILK